MAADVYDSENPRWINCLIRLLHDHDPAIADQARDSLLVYVQALVSHRDAAAMLPLLPRLHG